MKARQRQSGGWVLAEMVVSLTILGIVLGGWLLTQEVMKQFNAVQVMRRTCTAAAQAQLDSFTATGGPVDDRRTQEAWPGLTVNVRTSPGRGDWAGLTLVNVTAVGDADGRAVRVALARYVAAKEAGQ